MNHKISWQTDSIRLTLLGSVEAAPSFSWSALTGKQPESVTSRPQQQLNVEEGSWENGHLVVNSQPGRVEILFSAIPKDPTSIPSLGDFESLLPKFEALTSKVKLPVSARIAVGAKLNAFPGSQEKSDSLINGALPNVRLPNGCSDVIIQYNVPKKLPKISGLVINRIVKWSQLVVHTLQFVGGQQLANAQEHIVQLELDINTSPLSKLPHPDQYGLVLKALYAEVSDISKLENIT